MRYGILMGVHTCSRMAVKLIRIRIMPDGIMNQFYCTIEKRDILNIQIR